MIQLGNDGGGSLVPKWPDEGVDIDRVEHMLLHDYAQRKDGDDDGPAVQRLTAAMRVHARLLSHLLGKLDGIPDGDGKTLLDNALVVAAAGMGTTARSTASSAERGLRRNGMGREASTLSESDGAHGK